VEKSKDMLIISSFVFIIILFSTLSYLFIRMEYNEGFTAIEGLEIANKVAYEWNSSSVLVSIHSKHLIINGKSQIWRYSYSNNFEKDNNFTHVHIYVYSNERFEIMPEFEFSYIPDIKNLNIDSDEALDIIYTDQKFKQFNEKYDRYYITMGAFTLWESYPIWIVGIEKYDLQLEELIEIVYYINAETGAIIDSNE